MLAKFLKFISFFKQICGKTFKHDTSVDSNLAAKLFECAKEINVDAIRGNTLTANGFYEGIVNQLKMNVFLFQPFIPRLFFQKKIQQLF